VEFALPNKKSASLPLLVMMSEVAFELRMSCPLEDALNEQRAERKRYRYDTFLVVISAIPSCNIEFTVR
jgi:hypothetical protein